MVLTVFDGVDVVDGVDGVDVGDGVDGVSRCLGRRGLPYNAFIQQVTPHLVIAAIDTPPPHSLRHLKQRRPKQQRPQMRWLLSWQRCDSVRRPSPRTRSRWLLLPTRRRRRCGHNGRVMYIVLGC